MSERNLGIKDEILAKYLEGEANASEIKEVEVWLKESEDHERYFVKLKSLWRLTDKVAPERADVDVDMAWEKVSSRVDNSARPGPTELIEPKTRTLWPYIMRVAAVFIFGLIIYAAYQKYNPETVNEIVFEAKNEVRSEILSDESLVTMNVNSRITVAEKFEQDIRQVKLDGEAFFNVKPDPSVPFVIEAGGGIIKVLGTSFYVKAYDSLDVFEVNVVEGKVSVSAFGVEKILLKGDQIAINKNTGDIINAGYEQNNMFWKTRTLVFQNESLKKVFRDLMSSYNVSIEVENEKVYNCHLSGKFDQETVERIFEIIAANFDLRVTQQGSSFKITGDGCD
ncbi:FecR domain-containing protein [Fulvivirga sp.]|uniref:FecR family protein n=1 Tax=Fulvivirga sp. TaxID=1931237 RepID=UPI0032EE02F5